MTPASASQRLMVFEQLAGQLDAAPAGGGKFMMVVRSGKALSRDNRANRRMGGDFVQSIFHRAIAQVVPMLHAVNA